MRNFVAAAVAITAGAFAAPAFAQDSGWQDAPGQVEKALDVQAAPSAREVQSSVDAYLASAKADASLVGGCGQAGYDGGFWIRGGTFLMKINLTLQTRYEMFTWDDAAARAVPGGDLMGFSLPRVTLKFSGDATCDVHYYAELEFGHSGSTYDNSRQALSYQTLIFDRNTIPPNAARQANERPNWGIAREAWIEYEAAPQLAFRMGLIALPATRQLMTPAEMQQFVDISMASAYIGGFDIGYTSRNRDYGFMVHGALGCDGEWQYMVTVTNGDGPVHRNVLDGTTDDPLAYGARINWDIMGHMGYEEGALRQHSCEWTASLGAWINYFVDHRSENAIAQFADRLTWGVDLAVGWGGFSLTGAYNVLTWKTVANNALPAADGYSYLIQLGYLFPDTAWEIAARYSLYNHDPKGAQVAWEAHEWAAAVNYYIDGHADKVTLDVAFISPTKNLGGNFLADTMAGYNATGTSDGTLIRLQWQLAL